MMCVQAHIYTGSFSSHTLSLSRVLQSSESTCMMCAQAHIYTGDKACAQPQLRAMQTIQVEQEDGTVLSRQQCPNEGKEAGRILALLEKKGLKGYLHRDGFDFDSGDLVYPGVITFVPAVSVPTRPIALEDDVRVKRKKIEFHGADVLYKIVEHIRENPIMLPDLVQLKYFIEETPLEDQRIPVPDEFYRMLCAASIAERVFRVAEDGEKCARSSGLAYHILYPPVADGSEDSFHHFWDSLIYDPINTFLGGFVKNTRNESGEKSTYGTLRSDVTYYFDMFALLKAEEKGLKTAGDPASELVDKDFGLYFDSVPYILGYWAIGHKVTPCALYRVNGSKNTSRLDLTDLDLRFLDHRIRMLVVCLQFSKLLSVLKQICVKKGVEPDDTLERSNGKVVELIGSFVKKIYTDSARLRFVMSIYDVIKNSQYVEKVLRTSVEKGYMVFSRGINKQPLNERELMECMSCILNALVFIHSRGIMHRDVRWENIVKASTGKSWLLIDFDEATRSPCSYGCHLAQHNHAPEIAGQHDVKVDIWGVGYLLQKSKVFYTDNELENEIKNLEERCLSVDPGARPDAVYCLEQVQKIENRIKSQVI